jgi:hypothetical protein
MSELGVFHPHLLNPFSPRKPYQAKFQTIAPQTACDQLPAIIDLPGWEYSSVEPPTLLNPILHSHML